MEDTGKYTRYFPVSWERLHADSRALAKELLAFGLFKGIIAITRGGLVPAAVIARELNIRLIDTLCIVSYDWQKKGPDSEVLKGVQGNGDGFLVLDDLVDTGSTLKLARELLPQAIFATVYAKPAGQSLVDVYITSVSQDTWILFPWDSEIQYTAPIILREEEK